MKYKKFRWWNKTCNKMEYNVGVHPTTYFNLAADPESGFTTENTGWRIIANGDEGLTEFTGLCDKNGVEIYEGDIVKTDFNKDGSHNSIQVIEFWQGAFGSRNKNDHFRIPALFSGRATEGMNLNYYEVIGNIFEHQELLTDKNN